MATATGPVSCVLVGDDFGFTAITNRALARKELYVLWSNPGDIPVADRIRLSMWVALLRDALRGCLDVTVSHPDNSATVLSLQLGNL